MLCYFKQKTTIVAIIFGLVTAGLLFSGNFGLAFLAFWTSLASLTAYVASFFELCHKNEACAKL